MSATENPNINNDAKASERVIERRRSDQHFFLYANSAQAQVSLFDIKIGFGQTLEVNTERVVLENMVTVIMSPQHAKVLAGLLVQNVAQYERQFGEIKIPKGVMEVEMTVE